jgi:hypothetical protein
MAPPQTLEFIERLGLLAIAAVGCFFFVFLFWRVLCSRKTRGTMSWGRIVWLLLGGLSIILYSSVMAFGMWLHSPRFRSDVEVFTVVAMFLALFGWGTAEIAIALRAASGRRAAR